MKKFVTDFGISILPSSPLILLALLVVAVSKISTEFVDIERHHGGTPMHSVQLTQKGYIQVRIACDLIRGFLVLSVLIYIKSTRHSRLILFQIISRK